MRSSASTEFTRKAEISLRISEFEIPPMQDVLMVGRKAPVGPEAVRRMVDVLSPDQYEIIPVEQGPFEALVIRKSLTSMIPLQKLVAIVLEEGEKIADETTVIKAQVDVTLIVKRAVEL